jgi:hypothetical protein
MMTRDLQGPMNSQAGCRVCGSTSFDLDEVEHAGTLQLAECRRCRHRWTLRLARAQLDTRAARILPGVSRRMREVASAA